MTGLNLEPFLRLLQADVGAWTSLGLGGILLALIIWTGWGARRVLRKCLVLSVLAHLGLAFYGGEELTRLIAPGVADVEPAEEPGIREIRVALTSEGVPGDPRGSGSGPDGRGGGLEADRALAALAFAVPIEPEGRAASRPEPPPDDRPAPTALDRLEAPELSDRSPTPEPPVPFEPPDRAPALAPELDAGPTPEPSAIAPGEVVAEIRADRPADRPEAPPLPDPDRLASRPDPRGGRDAVRPPSRSGAVLPLPDLEPPAPARGTAFGRAADRAGPGRDGGPIGSGSAPVADDRPSAGPERPSEADPEAVAGPDRRAVARRVEEASPALPEADLRASSRPAPDRGAPPRAERSIAAAVPDLDRVVPGDLPDLPAPRGAVGGRSLLDVPEVYRPRLDPNRPEVARRAGASAASEEAVELALDWLARHQDADGRWDAGTARFRDGSPAPGDDSFTAHCPPGDICHGECFYWEADTAVTGLALLAFLGSGYTHVEGKYAPVVGRGVEFLVRVQRPDGDLRGPSRAVGMYCHAMATLALCEAYALSGDARLRGPVERAIGFLVEASYPGLMGWRYAPRGEITRKPAEGGQGWDYEPHPPIGDTSVLGWVVMALKSASEVGLEVPAGAVQSARNWLRRVADGDAEGLARYQPSRPADPVMTAEAWVCRQFLGVGGPGASSDEAAAYLLEHPPTAETFNIYYWYYATLAMYQHGGADWPRWNATVRDALVGLQHREGHKAGSWDPDPTRYGTHGGRVYATALAAMTLEVYYRYLRLYSPEAGVGGGPGLARPGDGGLRRAGGETPR